VAEGPGAHVERTHHHLVFFSLSPFHARLPRPIMPFVGTYFGTGLDDVDVSFLYQWIEEIDVVLFQGHFDGRNNSRATMLSSLAIRPESVQSNHSEYSEL
jgi:hypothetical protein